MKFAIRIFYQGGYENYPYLMKLDKNERPIKLITFKARNAYAATKKLSSLKFCKKLHILKDYNDFGRIIFDGKCPDMLWWRRWWE